MPNGGALKIHLFTISKRISAFGATCTRWMEVMVVTSLENFSTNITFAISTFNTERLLVILFTIGLTIFAHVLATQNRSTAQTSKNCIKAIGLKWTIKLRLFQVIYLKHQMCHCRSKAMSACPSFNSAPQPAQLLGSISLGLVGFWRISLCCCCAVALVGLDCCCCVTVLCLMGPPPVTHFSHKTSFPVFVTFCKIVFV